MANDVVLTKDNFEKEVVRSDIPVLVDFWAEWCMPCRMLTPTLEELGKDLDGRLKIGKVNVDEQGDLATKYEIVSIPTVMVFHKGEVVGRHVGLAPKHALENLVAPYLP